MSEEVEEIRLQKYLAECGIASRRKCEEYIEQGKVEVNGQVVKELGTKINPQKDKVKFENKEVKQNNKYIYILLNKPIGYVTTADEQFGRDKVLDLVKVKERVVPVGRLDMYTSGALILTNDGDFVYKVTHPKHEITKTYTVTIKGIIKAEEVEQLRKGVNIECHVAKTNEVRTLKSNDEKEISSYLTKPAKAKILKTDDEKEISSYLTKPAKVKILKTDTEKNISRLEIVIHEGKNRQVRRMCEAIGKSVIALHRSKIGNVSVKDIELGKWRYLKNEEVKEILKGSIK